MNALLDVRAILTKITEGILFVIYDVIVIPISVILRPVRGAIRAHVRSKPPLSKGLGSRPLLLASIALLVVAGVDLATIDKATTLSMEDLRPISGVVFVLVIFVACDRLAAAIGRRAARSSRRRILRTDMLRFSAAAFIVAIGIFIVVCRTIGSMIADEPGQPPSPLTLAIDRFFIPAVLPAALLAISFVPFATALAATGRSFVKAALFALSLAPVLYLSSVFTSLATMQLEPDMLRKSAQRHKVPEIVWLEVLWLECRLDTATASAIVRTTGSKPAYFMADSMRLVAQNSGRHSVFTATIVESAAGRDRPVVEMAPQQAHWIRLALARTPTSPSTAQWGTARAQCGLELLRDPLNNPQHTPLAPHWWRMVLPDGAVSEKVPAPRTVMLPWQ